MGLQLDVVRRENKNLADEIKDLLDQLGDEGCSIHELDKQRRCLEVEKEEIQAALEEDESALETEENKVMDCMLYNPNTNILNLYFKVLRAQLELDRKNAEKEEEFEKPGK